MLKRFLTLLLILPLLTYCDQKDEPTPDPEKQEEEKKDEEGKEGGEQEEPVDIYEKAGEAFNDGDELQATNPLVEKFLNEVNYPDETYNDYTKVLDYYGGFNGKAYNENGEEDPDGIVLDWKNYTKKWPNGDKPMKYSIR